MNSKFDLHKMGWESFQHLVGAIFREVLGQTLSEFSTQQDRGRDFAYMGNWFSTEGGALCGNFTIQCKHTNKEASTLTLSTIADELTKIENLVFEGLADIYILVTNHQLTASSEHNIVTELRKRGVKQTVVYGYEWIVQQIAENPKLRRLVPRLYGLGDLTQIVSNNAFAQTRAVLESQMSDLECFVTTSAYLQSAKALSDNGFVILIGEPASGKTTIASILALSAADEWALQTLIISSPEEFKDLWNPNDPGQFFWVDDAFGTTKYNSERGREWNTRLLLLNSAIKRGARVVFTSRDYVFRAAKRELQTTKFELFEESKVTVYCDQLNTLEKSRILYNHLKHGEQPKKFKTQVKPWLQHVVSSNKFLPETARRFGNPKFTRLLNLTQDSVYEFFDKPVKYLGELVTTLASSEQAALALIFCNGGRLATPIRITGDEQRIVSMMGSSLSAVRRSLANLEGSLVRRDMKFGDAYWCFKHPTIHDAFSNYVGKDPELIEIYLQGTSIQKIVEEVSCGVEENGGSYIHIPGRLYSQVMEKLALSGEHENFQRDQMMFFLAKRCDKEFLSTYFSNWEDMNKLPNDIRSLYLFDGSLRVLVRLRELGLLTEQVRLQTYKRIRYFCEERLDSAFLRSEIATLLTKQEHQQIVNHMREFVVDYGQCCVDEIEQNWDRIEFPQHLFAELEETLDYLVECTQDSAISMELRRLQLYVDDTTRKMESMSSIDYDREDWDWETHDEKQKENFGIFDDVDE